MESHYQQTFRLLTETQRQVHELSTLVPGSEQALESRVWDNLRQLEQDCYRLENMVRKEPPIRRQEAKYRVDQLLADFHGVQNAYRSYQQKRSATEQEHRQREELLSRRYTTNSAEGSDTSIALDHALHHHQQLQNANRGLDDIIANATGVISNLKNQGFTLKAARRKVLDIVNTLGISNTLMRLIERRTAQDKYIFWGGIVISITVMVLVVMYFT